MRIQRRDDMIGHVANQHVSHLYLVSPWFCLAMISGDSVAHAVHHLALNRLAKFTVITGGRVRVVITAQGAAPRTRQEKGL